MNKPKITFVIFFTILTNLSSQPLSRVYNLINGNEYGTETLVDDKGYLLTFRGQKILIIKKKL